MGDVDKLLESKATLKSEIDALQSEKNAIYDEKRKMQNAFNKWDKAQRLERQRQWEEEKRRKESEWEAEKARRELEMPNPFLEETTLLEQTILYCKSLLPVDDCQTPTPSSGANTENLSNALEGAKILLRKEDRGPEFFVEPTKKKTPKKKSAEKSKTAHAIKHTAETFGIFERLKMAAPMSTTDVPPILEKLEENLAGYNKKVSKWEAERKAKLEKLGEYVEKRGVPQSVRIGGG